MSYYMPVALAVLANVFYHISQKYTPAAINPFFSLFVTYLTAMVITAALFLCYGHEQSLREHIKQLNWAPVVLGAAIVLLEAAWLLIYRAGWNISTAQIIANALWTIVLVPVGVFLFKENVSLVNIIGVVVCAAGVALVSYSKG